MILLFVLLLLWLLIEIMVMRIACRGDFSRSFSLLCSSSFMYSFIGCLVRETNRN